MMRLRRHQADHRTGAQYGERDVEVACVGRSVWLDSLKEER